MIPLTSDNVLYILNGATTTIVVAVGSIAIATVFGVALGVLAEMGNAPLQWAVAGWVYLIRGVPILIWLFLSYFGLSAIGLRLPGAVVATVGIGVYMSALISEIIRGSIRALPSGQAEAGRALCLSGSEVMRHVLIPQALRTAFPPYISMLPVTIKASAFASIISVSELTFAAREMTNSTFQPLPIYGITFVIYFLLCYPVTVLASRLERRMTSYQQM